MSVCFPMVLWVLGIDGLPGESEGSTGPYEESNGDA